MSFEANKENVERCQQKSDDTGTTGRLDKLSMYSGGADLHELCSRKLGRGSFLQIDLDALTHNINIIRSLCRNKSAGVCAMVKGNAYGHGAVEVSRHLKKIGVERLGIATVHEGIELRNADIGGPIHLMGNVQDWEMDSCLRNRLIPTVSSQDAVYGMARALARRTPDTNRTDPGDPQSREVFKCGKMPPDGAVHIKVDSGMCRNGCRPDELMEIIQLCNDLGVPVEGVYSHLADFEDEIFTQKQETTFLEATKPLRDRNIMLHLANSGGIVSGVATNLDMVRPGISVYGLPPGGNVKDFAAKGFQPVASVKAVPSLVKLLQPGDKVGYGCTYECQSPEWLLTLPYGYADGYFRSLSNRGCVIREQTGERCAVVGRVSMDAITVAMRTKPASCELFSLLTDDYDPLTSAAGMATTLDTIPYEIMTKITLRVPRLYVSSTSDPIISKLT